MTARSRLAAGAAVTFVLGAAPASANTPEDLQGIGARVNAMGGAGTALSGDFTAAYYNSAALSRCADDHASVDIRHTIYDLHVRRRGADAPPDSLKNLQDLTRISTGFCFGLPYDLSMGLALGLGLQSPMALDAAAPFSRPQFVMYGDTLEQLSIALGFAYEPIPQVSLGFGGSILISTDLAFGAYVPIARDADGDGLSDPLGVALRLNVIPSGAPYAGIQVRPTENITIGFQYRGAMYLNLDVPATIRESALGLDIQIPIQVQGIGWYTPHQVAVGISGSPTPDLTLAADVTYYRWSALADTYYPFLAISPQPQYPNTIVDQLGFARMGNPGWRDVWQPRVGGEVRVMDQRVAIRGGWSYRPPALPLPGSRTMDTPLPGGGVRTDMNVATLLDAGVHSISLGAGYTFGDRPHEREDPASPTPAPEAVTPPPTAFVLPYDADGNELVPRDLEAEEELALAERARAEFEGFRGAQTRGGTGRPRTGGTPPATTPAPATPPATATRPAATPPVAAPAVPAPSATAAASPASPDAAVTAESVPPDEDLPGVTGQIDFFLRASLMRERYDVNKDISYGGSIYDVGIQLTLGWY